LPPFAALFFVAICSFSNYLKSDTKMLGFVQVLSPALTNIKGISISECYEI